MRGSRTIRAALVIGTALLAALAVACGGSDEGGEHAVTSQTVEQESDSSESSDVARAAAEERPQREPAQVTAAPQEPESGSEAAQPDRGDDVASEPAVAAVPGDDEAATSEETADSSATYGGAGDFGYGGAAADDDTAAAERESPAEESAAETAVAATAEAEEEPLRRLVVIDPGHGGFNTGAVGFGIVERESNLDFALRVEQLLLEAGFDVILTRRTGDRTAEVHEASLSDVPHFVLNRRDLQARVDLANEAGADLYVSIHSNGANDPNASGIEVYWDGQRSHSAENERLAQALQESVLSSLEIGTGYQAWDRGIREDTCWHISERSGECSAIFILGPAQEIERQDVIRFGLDPEALGFVAGQDVLVTRATQMPAALVELLFISNEWEAGVLKDETARQAMAIGIARGIERYFAEQALVSGAEEPAGDGLQADEESEGVTGGAG